MRKLSSLLVVAVLASPAMAADRPTVKFSFSLPAGGTPTYNAFDPEPLRYRRERHDIRRGHPEGALVNHQTLSSYAHLTPQNGRNWSARLRVQTWDPWKDKQTPLALDLSWTKERRTITQVWGSEHVSTGRYYERCPANPSSWCVDFGGMPSTSQSSYREHDLTLHVFRFGLNYDLLYNTKRFSLEPGIGLEWSLAKHRQAAEGSVCTNAYARCQQLPRTEHTSWEGINHQTAYVALSGDVYPLGKRRFLAVGASTRYLLTSGDWSIRNATLLENYEVPIRSRRWATTVHATLAF